MKKIKEHEYFVLQVKLVIMLYNIFVIILKHVYVGIFVSIKIIFYIFNIIQSC